MNANPISLVFRTRRANRFGREFAISNFLKTTYSLIEILDGWNFNYPYIVEKMI